MKLQSLTVYRKFIEFYVTNYPDPKEIGTWDMVYYNFTKNEIVCTCQIKNCAHAAFVYLCLAPMKASQIINRLSENIKETPEIAPNALALKLLLELSNSYRNSSKEIQPTLTYRRYLEFGRDQNITRKAKPKVKKVRKPTSRFKNLEL